MKCNAPTARILLALVSGVALLTGAQARAASPALVTDVAALERSASLLNDIDEIERLQGIYGYYLDRSDWDGVADLLTNDATAEYANSGLYVGKESVRKLLYAIGYGKAGIPLGQLREHMQFQPVIDVAPDGLTAKGRWRVFALLGQSGQYARWQAGPYENEYRKEGGRWKISKIRWYETFTVPLEGAWHTRMPQSNVADRKMPPPDRPSTSNDGSWPDVSPPRYHYSAAQVGRPCCVATGGVQPTRPKSGDLAVHVTRLRQQVQHLEDVRDIQILQRAYGYYVDKNLWPQVADLFAEDGTLEIGGRGVFVGKSRVLQYLQWLGSPVEGKLYDHTQLQPVVDVSADGKTAKGRWRALVFGGNLGGDSVLGDCIYENEYRKENGKWKIATLHAYFIMYTMLNRGGWGKFAMPNTRPEKTLPPDRPPTLVYDMYPGVLTAPNHFVNPVTGVAPAVATADAAAASNTNVTQAELSDLRHRLESLADVQAVEHLQNAFGYYIDKWQWDDAASLFAQDATLEVGQRGVYVGRAHIRHSFELDGTQGLHQGEVNDHIQYQPVIHLGADGASARARIRQIDVVGRFGGTALLGGGIQENEYVKVAGVWKFRKFHLYTSFLAEVNKGWSHGALPAPARNEEIPPDRGPTEVYRAFPGFYVPAFHYDNPVSGKPAAVSVAAANP